MPGVSKVFAMYITNSSRLIKFMLQNKLIRKEIPWVRDLKSPLFIVMVSRKTEKMINTIP